MSSLRLFAKAQVCCQLLQCDRSRCFIRYHPIKPQQSLYTPGSEGVTSKPSACLSPLQETKSSAPAELIPFCRKSGYIIESANFGSFADRALKSTSSRTSATFSFSRVKLAFPYKSTLGGTVRVRSLQLRQSHIFLNCIAPSPISRASLLSATHKLSNQQKLNLVYPY